MSHVKVRINIEVAGPIASHGKPVAIVYEHQQQATGGDNPRFYTEAIVDAVSGAVAGAIADVQQRQTGDAR